MKRIRLIVIIVALCISMAGCVYTFFLEGKSLYTTGNKSTSSAQAGLCLLVEAERNTFKESDVTMDLYCGLYDIGVSELKDVDYALSHYATDLKSEVLFGMYICDSDTSENLHMHGEYEDYKVIDDYYYIRTISYEEAKKEEYGYKTSIVGNITYNHCESLNISQDFFEEEEGSLEIVISSFMEPTSENPFYVANLMERLELKYKKTDDGKVVITNMKKE